MDGKAEFNVADGVGGLVDERGDPVVALSVAADGPGDGGAAAYGGLPCGAGLAEEVGEGEGSAAAVGAMEDDDVGVGEGDAVVELADGGVVPLADFTEVDTGENFGCEVQVLAGLRQMVDWDDGSDDRGELEQLDGHLGHVGVGQWNVRGCDGDLVVVELLDACFGAVGAVGDLDAGVGFAEGLDPGLIERGREGGARDLEMDGGLRGTVCG